MRVVEKDVVVGLLLLVVRCLEGKSSFGGLCASGIIFRVGVVAALVTMITGLASAFGLLSDGFSPITNICYRDGGLLSFYLALNIQTSPQY